MSISSRTSTVKEHFADEPLRQRRKAQQAQAARRAMASFVPPDERYWASIGDFEASYDGLGNIEIRDKKTYKQVAFFNQEALKVMASLLPDQGKVG